MSQLVPTNKEFQTVESFISRMSALESSNMAPTLQPVIVHLNGSTGEWKEKRWNETKKESEEHVFQDTTDGIFVATPLIVKYFCKWKYEEGAKSVYRTREFQNFKDEPVELLKITYGDKTTTEVKETFGSYQDFKAKFTKTDELTGKVSTPYDFFVALYAYHWASNRIIKIQMKGASRGAWFDFTGPAKEQTTVKSLTELQVSFGKKKESMKDGKIYYSADLSVKGVNSSEEMKTIMASTLELITWMNSFKTEKKEELPIIEVEEQEIRTEELPF